ncbi:MAG: DUF3991 and TOPRIM domain-containing protein [Ruminococcus sp.]|jgi:hypothetical protein|nr:DUF3991 and TOPRIM domain-containing protein [Ruminococcus sp.]
MLYTEEQIQRANERSISDYFRHEGYSCKKIRSETHIAGFGGFYVKDSTIPNQFYIHSQQKGGVGLVNCLMKVFDMPFKDAVRTALDGELGQTERTDSNTKYTSQYRTAAPSVPEPKPEFVMPEKGADNRRVYSYLTKTRCIDPSIVNEFIRAGVLYQDTKGNAVYLHKSDGKPCGAEIHGTSGKSYTVGNARYSDFAEDKKVIPTEPYIAELLDKELKNGSVRFAGYIYENNANIVTDSTGYDAVIGKISEIQSRNIDRNAVDAEVSEKLKNYKGVAPGTSESFFRYDKGEPKKAYVFESSIDLMSFMALHPDVTDCTFAAMAGLKPNVVEKLLAGGLPVTLCVDNDQAGQNFANQFGSRCKYFTECRANNVKDFNELLKAKKTVPFSEKVDAMRNWADKAIQKITDEQSRKVALAR